MDWPANGTPTSEREEITPLLGEDGTYLSKSSVQRDEYTYVDLLPDRHTPVSQSGEPEPEQSEIRTYWWRWVVLAVFCLNLWMNNVFWETASPIADVMRCYYQVDNFWVNSLSSIYMIVYIVLALPIAWMLERFGLRFVMILATCASAIGAGLRVAGSGAQFGFWLLLSGQGVTSLTNVLIWGAAPLLSEVWFPPSERATATAFAGALSPIAGILLGIGMGPLVVHRSDTDEVCGNDTVPAYTSSEEYADWSNTIYNQLFYYLLGQAAVSLVILVLTFIAFPDAPPTPPSLSRQLETTHEQSHGLQQVKDFAISALKSLTNVYFLLFLLTAGIMVGAYGTILTVINEMVLPYFPGHDRQIAYLGIISQACALVSILLAGRLLDWTKAFYAMNVIICVSGTLAVALFVALIQYLHHQHLFYTLYIASGLVGASLAPFLAVAYEYGVEMTYPLPEGTSAAILNISTQIWNFVMIEYTGYLLQSHKLRPYGLWAMVGAIGVAVLAAVFTRPQLKRLKIDSGGKEEKPISREINS